MTDALGLLETTGLTPAMVAIDAMLKAGSVRVLQVELNDLYGVCVKLSGKVADVETALRSGQAIAQRMQGRPIVTVIPQPSGAAWPAIQSADEFNPLIQQNVVFAGDSADPVSQSTLPDVNMKSSSPMALGFIETQGFTAVFEAIDTACKAADVEVVGKEKLGGGYVTVVIQGELSAVATAVAAGKERVGSLGKLIAAHVVARPCEAVLKLLPRV